MDFAKLKLFVDEILALGCTHKVGGVVQTKEARSIKIRTFPVPREAKDVRSFIGVTGITRRWCPNYSEICRPLNAIIKQDVEFDWGPSQQLSFEFLREKCASIVEVFGFDPALPSRLYSDASGYAGGCCITQKQVDRDGSGKLIEYPLHFDSFLFNPTERNYGTYKRELFSIINWCRKYYYMLVNNEPSTIFTDHKPLTYFLRASAVNGIYARWQSELHGLNVVIIYIEGKRNKVADGLSRTIFPDPDGGTDDLLNTLGDLVEDDNGEPKWVWKDGKGGYDELLRLRQITDEHASYGAVVSSRYTTIVVSPEEAQFDSYMKLLCHNAEVGIKSDLYSDDPYFYEIFNYITMGQYPDGSDRLQKQAIHRKSTNYKVIDSNDQHEGVLFFNQRGVWRRCIPQKHVADTIRQAHDCEGHWKAKQTLKKLSQHYWPTMVKDTVEYILGCLRCAKHGPAQRTQPLSPIIVDKPNILL